MTFFKVVSGSLQDPENLAIEIIDFFLMDLGTSGFTSFKYTPEITEYQMENEHLIEDGIRTGCLHSHHFMPTFFSGEDIDDLVINTKDKSVDFYLSTIVNVEGKWIARVAYRMSEVVETESQVETTSNFWSKLLNGTPKKTKDKMKTKVEKSTLCMIPLEVVQEEYQDVVPRMEALRKISTTHFTSELRPIPHSDKDSEYPTYDFRKDLREEGQGKLFDQREQNALTESQEEENDRLLGSLMMGSIAFKDGLDKAMVLFRQRCTDSLGNAYNQMIDAWAHNVVEKADTIVSIAEGKQMGSNYVNFCLADLMDTIYADYVQADADAEAMLADAIEDVMEMKAAMEPEGITINDGKNGRHF